MKKKQKKVLIRILITAALLIVLHFVPFRGVPRFISYFTAYIIIGYDILRKAFLGIRNGRPLDECFLMTVATLGAFFLAVYTKSGDYTEGVAVMLFYQIGELFQSIAVGKSRKNIADLMDIRPDFANVEENGVIRRVSPEEVPVGSVITVQPGERVPLDGVVLTGSSALDTAALTGESIPRTVRPGDVIISGCIALNGLLTVRTTREAGESTVSKILELVENAAEKKAKTETVLSRFASVYTPAVCGAAVLLAVSVPLARVILRLDPGWSVWLYRALTFLVVSCPCALVISIPLCFFAAIGGASRQGILVKGSNDLEALARVGCVVFDKTGTLTEGVFEVSEIHPADSVTEDALLEFAALSECASSHPIAKSLLSAYGKTPDRSRVTEVEEHSGLGITATVDGHHVAVGNEKLLASLNLDVPPADAFGTVLFVAINHRYAGSVVISDRIKKESPEAVRRLHACGVKQTVMLTGDSFSAAEAVAKKTGMDSFMSNLLPDEKVRETERLLAETTGKATLAFVGDGINDAPVLARSDIGIAMGAIGSDAAIEAADVVLMDDNPLKIPKAVRIAKKAIRIVWENILFSLGVKLACLILSALGIASMGLAVFADVGVMVIAVLNAVRMLRSE